MVLFRLVSDPRNSNTFRIRRTRCSPCRIVNFSLVAAYGTRGPHKNIRARGRIIFLFSHAPRARAGNQANQQCQFKSSRYCIELLDTDSCRGTVPMEPPMSNSSMHHTDPDLDFDDMRVIVQGASCTIAARAVLWWPKYPGAPLVRY